MKRTLLALPIVLAPTALLAHCSSDPTAPTVLPTADGAPPRIDAALDAPQTPIPDATSPQDASSDCGKPPTLHPSDGGIYCPFSAQDGGANLRCDSLTEQCCETPSGGPPGTCEPKGGACPVDASIPWQCEAPADCPAGQRCCAFGGPVTIKDDTCGPFLSKFSGTRCAATCAAGEIPVCESTDDCATCVAVKPKGNEIGVCR